MSGAWMHYETYAAEGDFGYVNDIVRYSVTIKLCNSLKLTLERKLRLQFSEFVGKTIPKVSSCGRKCSLTVNDESRWPNWILRPACFLLATRTEVVMANIRLKLWYIPTIITIILAVSATNS